MYLYYQYSPSDVWMKCQNVYKRGLAKIYLFIIIYRFKENNVFYEFSLFFLLFLYHNRYIRIVIVIQLTVVTDTTWMKDRKGVCICVLVFFILYRELIKSNHCPRPVTKTV